MEPLEGEAAPSHWLGNEDLDGRDEETGPPEAQIQSGVLQDQRPPRTKAGGLELQQSQQEALQLEFQDSNLSPALLLLPLTSGLDHSIVDCSFAQQSDPEFAPLRAFPDFSVVSEGSHFPGHENTTHLSEQNSLSQHPLAQATLFSEERANENCSPAQHSLSPKNKVKQEETVPPRTSDAAVNTHERLSGESSTEMESETLSYPTDRKKGEMYEDQTFFLNKDIPAKQLLDLLQKEVGMQNSSSSTVSSQSQTSSNNAGFHPDQPRHTDGFEDIVFERQGPPGEAGSSQLQKEHKEIGNITTGSRGTQPDDSSEELHRELRRLSSLEASKNPKGLTSSHLFITPSLKESQGQPSGKPFSMGSEWIHREQVLRSSQSQTLSDGSYLGFFPQSQSTPGIFFAPMKFDVKAKLGHLSAIESNKKALYQSSTDTQSADDHLPGAANQCAQDAQRASDKVHSLPSLNYLQKVDAWRTKQSSERTPLFEGRALDVVSRDSPKKKSDEIRSNTLKPDLTQHALQQPSANQDVAQISSCFVPLGGSSPRRGEAVGGAPADTESKGPLALPSVSPFGRSQSFSSLNTVVTSADKHQQTNVGQGNKTTQSQRDSYRPPIQPSPLDSLGHFSDVSVDQELSSSQDSYTEIKVGPSVGASSVVSLELDNYAPYWTFKRSATSPPPPASKDLNIDERIPLYLQNLGIDQTPSKILTPFAPRGPIREPEFSPTDLCTIKGSSGTPSKSTQHSEGSSPQKGEFSRSSVLSVDSSISVPFSLDSLGPAASASEQVRATTSLPPDSEASQREDRTVSCSRPDEHSHSSFLHSYQQQQQLDAKQDFIQMEDKSESNSLAKIIGLNRNLALQSSNTTDQDAESSFVSTKALSEIRKLLSQAENMTSTGSSTASSGPTAPHLFSEKDMFRPPKTKTSRLHGSSFSRCSSTDGDLKSHSSLPWARSSSDSMLTSHKPNQSSAGRECLPSSWQPDNPSIQSVNTGPQAGTVSAGTSVLSKSARRTEPEGCSAAPPDTLPKQPSSTQQFNLTSGGRAGVAEEEKATPSDPGADSHSYSPVVEDAEQDVISDGSSESSLAVRVAKLLQNESPATMASSTPSVTDPEEGKAREWIKSKVSGQQCEPLRLDVEDRRRVEEIKKELLLRKPMKSEGSTDTEGSAATSAWVNESNSCFETNEGSSSLADADKQLGLSVDHSDPHTQPQSFLHVDLEARVCEIAAREGVTLLTSRSQVPPVTASASISPAPPLSPASQPLQLTELSSNKWVPTNLDETQRLPLSRATREPPSVDNEQDSCSSRNRNAASQSAPEKQKRQDAVGGQSEEPPPPTQALDKHDAAVNHVCTQFPSHHEEMLSQTGSFSAVGHKANQAFRTSPFTHVPFTPPPEATGRTSASAGADLVPCKGFATLRDSSSAASSPDEGVGSSSPAEWPARDRSDASAGFKAVAPQRNGILASSSQMFTQRPRAAASPRPFTAETPVPVLLPYKPLGSEELFYVPQTEADVSSISQSDTTIESSHTGSDDAVAPSFSSEVLGDQDPGLDRGVAIRHEEGIYSKRLKTALLRMEPTAATDASAAADKASPPLSQSPKPSPQVPATVCRSPSVNIPKVSKRDQGTSPIQFLHHKQAGSLHPSHRETVQLQDRERGPPPSAPHHSNNDLDHLWQKFCDQWSKEESHPTGDKEAPLLERLERLSRLIHHTQAAPGSDVPEGQGYHLPEQPGRTPRRKERKEGRRREHGGDIDRRWEVGRGVEAGSTQNQQPLSPADRDQPESLSTLSGSTSTVDTARLIRAFGADRVKHLRSSSSLRKLYSTINKQREVGDHWEGAKVDSSVTLTPSETPTTTDESVVPDSTSTSSTCTASPLRGPSRALTAKRAVRLVNKGIQAGELEIVRNGTRPHTRDVGTTFPSPGEARASEQISSSSFSNAGRRGGGWRVLPKSTISQMQKKSKRSPSKPYPKGVSWFISADNLRSEMRKENRPDESPVWRPITAWFEPYSRVQPWREPLRQRQVHEDGSNLSQFKDQPELDPNPKTKLFSSSLARVSLQEALEMRRPGFISRSKQRVRRLALQAEERRLQTVFSRERNLLFNRPGEAQRLAKPAGTSLLKRAVPRKEMIQRSKQIYENLPEVRRRREEERRKAEYQTYRLNAQLYNKRIRNRVLGRRTAWH